MSLDPRPAQPTASTISTPEGHWLLQWVCMANITNAVLEVIAEKTAKRVIELLDARDKEKSDAA